VFEGVHLTRYSNTPGSSVIELNITLIVVLHLIVTVWHSMATTYNTFIKKIT
jgi:hypothetical protein